MNLWLRRNLAVLLLGIFAFAYVILLLTHSNFGPTDDYTFLRTIQQGKPLIYFSSSFPYYDIVKIGRFMVLDSVEYNLLLLFSKSPAPFWYFFIHAIQFLIFIILFIKILGEVTKQQWLKCGIPILLALSPAFTISWFRLQLTERNVLFYLTIFMLLYLLYQKRRHPAYLILGIIAANIALHYKETVFIALGVFAAAHLIFLRKNSLTKARLFDYLILVSILIYLAAYYFLIFPNRGIITFIKHDSNQLVFLIKNLLKYALLTDPLIVFLVIPFALWRLGRIFIYREEAHSLYDSMLAAATAYAASFFILGVHTEYYLLPVYFLAIPALIYYFTQPKEKKLLTWKVILVATSALTAFTTLPLGLHYLTYDKYNAINFQKTLRFLTQEIVSQPSSARPAIFLDNIPRSRAMNLYHTYTEFFLSQGLSEKQFDLKSTTAVDGLDPAGYKIKYPFTVFKLGGLLPSINKGDYLIIGPFTPKNADKNYLQALEQDYDLVFQAQSKLVLPSLTALVILKRAALKQSLTERLHLPNYYVFVKK